MCGLVLFYIIVFGMLLCPDGSKAWNEAELAEHQGATDYYAAIAGKVYDVSTLSCFVSALTPVYELLQRSALGHRGLSHFRRRHD